MTGSSRVPGLARQLVLDHFNDEWKVGVEPAIHIVSTGTRSMLIFKMTGRTHPASKRVDIRIDSPRVRMADDIHNLGEVFKQ